MPLRSLIVARMSSFETRPWPWMSSFTIVLPSQTVVGRAGACRGARGGVAAPAARSRRAPALGRARQARWAWRRRVPRALRPHRGAAAPAPAWSPLGAAGAACARTAAGTHRERDRERELHRGASAARGAVSRSMRMRPCNALAASRAWGPCFALAPWTRPAERVGLGRDLEGLRPIALPLAGVKP